jgi:TP901 family phage tail tape measure protein
MAFKLAEAFVEITGKDTKFKQSVRSTETAFAASVKRIERNATRIGVALAAVGAGITAAFASAVRTTATFQQSMANTQSVVGATSEDLQRLTGFAREMGKQSVFSATEAANAMYFLGSAGFDTEKIMKSLRGTLLLAAATQSDLAFTSGTVAATLSAFGLAAQETDRVANVFAATIASSQATMERLSTSMSFVGPVARSVGLSLEDTTSILGSLFNAGIDASTAGTALRQSIAQLLKPSGDATAALDRLGVTVLDTSGNLRPMIDIIRDLEKAGLSTADAMSIFGIRAGPAMLALVNKGADAIENLTKKVTGTNKAAESAEIQMSTFQGQLTKLKSAFQELQIAIGTTLLPTLTEYVQKMTEIINKTSEWAAENPKLTKTLATLGATVGVTALALGGLSLAAPGLIAVGKAVAGIGSAAVAALPGLTGFTAGIGTLAAIAAPVIATMWAVNRAVKAWNTPIDIAARSIKILTKDQKNLARAIEDVGIELREFEDKGLHAADATLGDLNINVGKLNRLLGTNFQKTTNAGLALSAMERSLDRTTTELNKLNGVVLEVTPNIDQFKAGVLGLVDGFGWLTSAIKDVISPTHDAASGFTVLRQEMDFLTAASRAIQDAREHTEAWATAARNVKNAMNDLVNILPDDEGGRYLYRDTETMDELIARIRKVQKAEREFRRGREKAPTGALFPGDAMNPAERAESAEKRIRAAQADTFTEFDKRTKTNLAIFRESLRTREGLEKAAQDKLKEGFLAKATLFNAEEDLRLRLLASLSDNEKQFYRKITGFQKTFVSLSRTDLETVKTMWANAGKEIETGILAGFIQFRNNLPDFKDHSIDVLNDIKGAFTNLFENLFSGNTKDLWERFWDDLKSIASRKLAEIAANELIGNLIPVPEAKAKGGNNIFDAIGGIIKDMGIKLGISAVTGSAAPGPALGPAFADGGIVRRPTLATIGEAGAEAVIPLRGGKVPVELSGGGRTIIIQSMPISFPNANLDNIDDTMLEKNMTRMIPHIQRAIDGGEIKIA